jgi:NAD-dependent dihydropyrimidine dehydrogenase PreA subunit
MTYVITQACAGTCNTGCLDVCPVDCIVGPLARDAMRGGPLQMFIDPDECIECNACVSECPVDAIVLDTDADPADIGRNAAFFRAIVPR